MANLPRQAEEGRFPGLGSATAISVAALIGSLAGFHWEGWTALPVTIRFLAGLVAFGWAPGLLMVGPFLLSQRRQVDVSDAIISVITCSFSCNLLLNAALFTVDASFTDLSYWYVLVQLLGYTAWGAWRWRRGIVSALPVTGSTGWSTVAMVIGIPLTLGCGALVYVAYVNGSPPANPEELLWLRKLVSNPVVRYDNLSYREGDPSTYFFVPFQILVAGTAVLAHMDVALAYSVFWAVTTALSVFVIARLAQVVFGRTEITALVLLWMVLIGLFDPNTVVNAIGAVTPYPNRYGFASGVLLPLSLILFWAILRDPVTHLWRWALLVYLTIEMTFVHARETLLGLGALVGVFMVLAAHPRTNRTQVARIAVVLGVTGVVLLVYKYANLALAVDLGSYVTDLSRASRQTLDAFIDKHGLLGAVFTAAKEPIVLQVFEGETLALAIPTYRNLFVEVWSNTFPGRLFMPITLLALPVYAWSARSMAELSLATVLTGLAILTSSAYLEYSLAAIVGNPEVFGAHNLVFLCALLVFCSGAWRIGTWLVEWRPHSKAWHSGLLLGCAGLALLVFVFDQRVEALAPILADVWRTKAVWLLTCAAVGAIAYRLIRSNLPLFPETRPLQAPLMGFAVAVSLIVIVAIPAVRGSAFWQVNPFTPLHPSYAFTGDFLTDYDRLEASNKLDGTPYPVEVVKFLYNGVPPNQTVLAADVLTLLERVPHFTPVVSSRRLVATSFIINWDYLRRYSRSGTNFELLPFVADAEGRELLRAMLTEYAVDIVLVPPEEGPAMTAAREQHDKLRTLLREVFSHEGFIVYQVDLQ